MLPERIHYLLQQKLAGRLTDAEKEELNGIIPDDQYSEQVKQELVELMMAGQPVPALDERIHKDMVASILEADKVQETAPVRRMGGWWKLAAAAAILFVVCGLWLVVGRRDAEKPAVTVTPVKDVAPGADGAILTLADGRQIVLDSIGNGNIAQQTGASIVKHGSILVYNATDSVLSSDSRLPTPDSRLTYNTITTPKGRQFQLQLPDGSRVWLNAASSVRYPTVFAANERRVEVTGEVYFEVMKMSNKMPFLVDINSAHGRSTVEVLGTHFNINAYDDEPDVRTTLLEGKVLVRSEAGKPVPASRDPKSDGTAPTSDLRPPTSVTLQPGEQAVTTNHKLQTTNKVNLDAVMAWKNGFFHFENASLSSVMRQLSRWYNVEVVFEKGAPADELFAGEMERSLKLTQVLKLLSVQQVHFRIEDGKRIIVTP